MASEIITAIIMAVSAVMVATIQYRQGGMSKKLNKDLNGLKSNQDLLNLKDTKKKAFDDREEKYNELSICIARHMVYKTDISTIEKKLYECIEEDEKYREAYTKYANELSKLLDDTK